MDALSASIVKPLNITATIITFNEEEHIQAAIESVSWANDVLVVDSRSTDSTREIARRCGAQVIEREWPGFAAQKQFAADWLVSASYMGGHAVHVWGAQELNPAVYIPGTCQAGQYGLAAGGPCS